MNDSKTSSSTMESDESPDLLNAILDVADVLVVVLDPRGRIVRFNRACERVTGYRIDEVRDQTIWECLIFPEEVEAVRGVFSNLRSGRLPSHHLNYWRTRNGERRLIQWSNTILGDSQGNVQFVVGTGIDVSELQRVRDQLTDREARLVAVLNTAIDGIITIDERGIIQSVNPATERIFGYTAVELIGQNVKVLMPSPYRESHDDYLEQYLRTGERKIIGIGREVEGRRKDGTIFPLDLAVSEVRLGNGRLFTGLARDISDRRRAEQQAQQRLEDLAHASRLSTLGELTSGIAHEVNQPLTAIISFAEACLRLLEGGHGNDEKIRGALEQIAAQGHRAGDIVQNLRELARKGKTEASDVDLNEAIRDVIGLLGHEVKKHETRLEVTLEDSLPAVYADKTQIEQVTMNLLRNALESVADVEPEHRRISVSSSKRDSEFAEVTVSDTGIGIAAGDLDRVFDTFYTTKANGMGMGLSISRSILEVHGGKLWVDARAGPGTSFRFTVPFAETDTRHG